MQSNTTLSASAANTSAPAPAKTNPATNGVSPKFIERVKAGIQALAATNEDKNTA
ncbi:MAG: hypothetical protein OEZ02_15960 [Anaerolineae bacterium]|nr:hypothetical protein [Anaerolineae bacterium]